MYIVDKTVTKARDSAHRYRILDCLAATRPCGAYCSRALTNGAPLYEHKARTEPSGPGELIAEATSWRFFSPGLCISALSVIDHVYYVERMKWTQT